MNLSTPGVSTLQMELEEDNVIRKVICSTLVKQTRDFIVITRHYRGHQNRNESDLISIRIKEPVNGTTQDVTVQDCQNGRYTFNYQPNCPGNYQVTVKVNGDDIPRSPFTWQVEQWHLVARNRENDCLKFLEDNMTACNTGAGADKGQVVGSCGLLADCCSWKFKVKGGEMYLVGVTDCNTAPARDENAQYWLNGSKCCVRNGDYSLPKQRSNITEFKKGDIGIVHLNRHSQTLTVFHPESGQKDIWKAEYKPNTVIYPFFSPNGGSQMTLLL